MKYYIKIRWIHNDPEYPVLFWSELDESRYEIRKVEMYADGRIGYAHGDIEVGDAWLGEVPVPLETEIAADPQFVVEPLTPDEFEQVWYDSTR